ASPSWAAIRSRRGAGRAQSLGTAGGEQMTSLEMRNPGLAGTKSGGGVETDCCRNSTDKTTLQASRHKGLLIVLASWLVRIEHRKMARKIPSAWDAALSLQ